MSEPTPHPASDAMPNLPPNLSAMGEPWSDGTAAPKLEHTPAMPPPTFPMRRKDRALTREEALNILARAEVATVSMITEAGPYAVPVSPVCLKGTLYFHAAKAGRKAETLRRDPRVWVSAIGAMRSSDTLPADAFTAASDRFTVFYESAMAWGSLREVTVPHEKAAALRALCEKFTPSHMDAFGWALAESLPRTAVYALPLTTVSGKAKRLPKTSAENRPKDASPRHCPTPLPRQKHFVRRGDDETESTHFEALCQ